jgi:hypothetical protein
MTKTLTLTASMMILLAISGHASRARYLPVATHATALLHQRFHQIREAIVKDRRKALRVVDNT